MNQPLLESTATESTPVAQTVPDAAAPAPRRPVFWSRTNVVALIVMSISVLWLAGWFIQRAGHVYVDDARIATTMVAVSSRVAGWLEAFPVSKGQVLDKGTLLARLDDRAARLAVEEIQARLQSIEAEYQQIESQLHLVEEQVGSRIDAQQSLSAASRASLSDAELALNHARRDFDRAEALLKEQIITREQWEDRRADYERAREKRNRALAEVGMASATLHEAQVSREQLEVLTNQLEIVQGRRNETQRKLEQARLNLDYHSVRANQPGVVDETFVHAGEFVATGQRMLMMHDPRDIWIKANVKETELQNVRLNAPVNIVVDAYPDHPFHGVVSAIGNAATSQFALLPSPNPSGNFTKVTQRIEVRVDVEQEENLLKPGMMVELEIDIL